MEQLKLVKTRTSNLIKKAEKLNKQYSQFEPSSEEANSILDSLVNTMSEITQMQRRAVDIAKEQRNSYRKQSA